MTIFSTECYIMHPFLHSLLRIAFPTLHPKVTEEYLTFPKKIFCQGMALQKDPPSQVIPLRVHPLTKHPHTYPIGYKNPPIHKRRDYFQ